MQYGRRFAVGFLTVEEATGLFDLEARHLLMSPGFPGQANHRYIGAYYSRA
jgi:hypothetical protein